MPAPDMSSTLLRQFSQSSVRYAEKMIRAADANGNGKLTRKEATALGDLKDTYDLFVRAGKTVSTEKFIQFYKDYVHVASKRGALPNDLKDNYQNWLDARLPAPSAEFTTRAAEQGEDLTAFVINWRSDVADYYEYGDEDYILADATALRTYFAGAEWQPTQVPEGKEAYKALKAVNHDPNEVLEGGEVVLLFNKRANVTDMLYRHEGELYSVDDVSSVIDLSRITPVARVQEAAEAIANHIRDDNLRADFPPYWDEAFGVIHASGDTLTVIYDYEFFAGSDFTEDEHVDQMSEYMTDMIANTPALAQYADIPLDFFGPWGT